jgi:hypothetical protein
MYFDTGVPESHALDFRHELVTRAAGVIGASDSTPTLSPAIPRISNKKTHFSGMHSLQHRRHENCSSSAR